MIELHPFDETDIPRLIGWVPDARFLLQWSGPQYVFPLDASQLLATLKNTRTTPPKHLMFKAVHQPDAKVVGHIEFMNIDYSQSAAMLARVLIGHPSCRGRGWGQAMVEAAANYGFATLGMTVITLAVFDFNTAAMACYTAAGFREYERRPRVRRFGDEDWNLIMMRLDRTSWQNRRSTRIG